MPFDFTIAPHQAAAKAIRGKRILSQDVFYGMLRELRGRAFTISGVTSANVMQKVRDRLAELPEGGNWEDIKEDIAQDMEPYLGEGAERRAELLLKVHGFQAYQAAAWRELHSDDTLTHVQYMSTEDDRVRTTHQALNGIILPKGDPFWLRHWPPWEWGCRCNTRGVLPEMVDEAREADASRPPEEQLVFEGPMAEALRNGHLIRGGRAHWVGPPEGEGAWYWSPADLQLPVTAMQRRYDPAVWGHYEAAAKRTQIDDRTTLWDWMHEASPPARAAVGANREAPEESARAPVGTGNQAGAQTTNARTPAAPGKARSQRRAKAKRTPKPGAPRGDAK